LAWPVHLLKSEPLGGVCLKPAIGALGGIELVRDAVSLNLEPIWNLIEVLLSNNIL